MSSKAPQQTTAPKDKFCDLVMKGGIASGIIYPQLIGALAKDYHFKSIGGTSAGAIAAAATAAAEYQRRCTGSMAGYELLDRLPEMLGATDRHGRTRLLRLFQPHPSCKRLFKILETVLNRKRARGAALWAVLKLPWIYGRLTILAIAIVLAPILVFGAKASIVVAASAYVLLLYGLAVIFAIYQDLTHALVDNNFGLCSGLGKAHDDDALTPWLHELIQTLAGRSLDDPPLCFHELWEAPNPPAMLAALEPEKRRSIDLRMFTTNLHHGRPYMLPHSGKIQRLYFTQADLQPVLPTKVLSWLFENSPRYERRFDSEPPRDSTALREQIEEVRELVPQCFPVLLATRLSLSFPLLLSAVRLRVMNFDTRLEKRTFRPCLFSDGGLCANFPIHLFDGVLPTWPTFGVQLEPLSSLESRSDADRTYLPDDYGAGYGERWNQFDREKDGPAKLFGFLSALFDSSQNWNDNSMSRMPGVRDRVVRIRLNNDEGGLNLNMKKELITHVAGFGLRAAHKLQHRFAPANAQGWKDQRKIRLGVLVGTLREKLERFRNALQAGPNTDAYAALLQDSVGKKVPGFADDFSPNDLCAIQTILRQLDDLANTLAQQQNHYPFEIVPDAALHVRPEL